MYCIKAVYNGGLGGFRPYNLWNYNECMHVKPSPKDLTLFVILYGNRTMKDRLTDSHTLILSIILVVGRPLKPKNLSTSMHCLCLGTHQTMQASFMHAWAKTQNSNSQNSLSSTVIHFHACTFVIHFSQLIQASRTLS